VATALPIPPCIIRIDRFKKIRFGFCSAGTTTPNLAIDAMGNVRSCNLSSQVLGNVLEEPFERIIQHRYLKRLGSELPRFCRACYFAKRCRGGCKESAQATFGSLSDLDPFVQFALRERDTLRSPA
jgi:radical SAM protein with 4Fe4S-binding SPASM domain